MDQVKMHTQSKQVSLSYMKHRLGRLAAVAVLLTMPLAAVPCHAQNPPAGKLWLGQQMFPFNGPGGDNKGDPTKGFRTIPGAFLQFQYSGTGPLPAPQEMVIPLDQPLPAGTYWLYVKNSNTGKMEATLGEVTKPLEMKRFDWTAAASFQVDKPLDRIVLRYFPAAMTADNGAAQKTSYIVQGVFLTPDANQAPPQAMPAK